MNPRPLTRWPRCCALALTLAVLSVGCLAHHSGPLPGEPPHDLYLSLTQEDARIRYKDIGDGPPVVLIHGFAASMQTWDAVAASLADDHRVIALDLKGFGWSDRREGDYSPQAQARVVLALLDHLGVDRAMLVAHSWGASVALATAIAAPERVERLALYDAWVYEEQLPSFFHWARHPALGESLMWLFYQERIDERMALGFHDKGHLTEAFVEEVEDTLQRPGTLAASLAAIRGQRFAELQRQYRAVHQPVLLLWGREDAVTLPSYGERLLRELPRARLTVYPGCGHFPMIEALGASTTDLRGFLAQTTLGHSPRPSTPPTSPTAPEATSP